MILNLATAYKNISGRTEDHPLEPESFQIDAAALCCFFSWWGTQFGFTSFTVFVENFNNRLLKNLGGIISLCEVSRMTFSLS